MTHCASIMRNSLHAQMLRAIVDLLWGQKKSGLDLVDLGQAVKQQCLKVKAQQAEPPRAPGRGVRRVGKELEPILAMPEWGASGGRDTEGESCQLKVTDTSAHHGCFHAPRCLHNHCSYILEKAAVLRRHVLRPSEKLWLSTPRRMMCHWRTVTN